MRGVPWKRPGRGHPEGGRLHWWKSPLSHRPHHLRCRRRPRAGREGEIRANFKLSACPSLPAPQSLLVHGAGRGPFADGPPYLSSCSPRSAPRRRPFPVHSVSGPGLWKAHHHLPGCLVIQSAPGGEVRASGSVLPCSQAWLGAELRKLAPWAWGLPWNVPQAPGPQPAFLALRACPASGRGREKR